MRFRKVMVFLPALNERPNLERLLPEIESLGLPGLEVIVVDGGSTDGTAFFLKGRSRGKARLVAPPSPSGRGLAGRVAFAEALAAGADALVEMDADGSHDPKEIPALLRALEESGAALVVGSRRACVFRAYGHWPWPRRALTLAGNGLVRLLFGLPVWDANSGFRCYSKEAVARLAGAGLRSEGSDIVHESLLALAFAGLRIVERPITFYDRRFGRTTKTPGDFLRALATCLSLRRAGRRRFGHRGSA